MYPMTEAEVSLPDMAITFTLMADPILTTSGQEIGITQPIREAPVVVAEADAPAHVLAPVQVEAVPAAARKTATEKQREQAYND
jgi:hypothetical protein